MRRTPAILPDSPKAIDNGQTVGSHDMALALHIPSNLSHIKYPTYIPSFAVHSHNTPMCQKMAQIPPFL
jgi:hypothetical protein